MTAASHPLGGLAWSTRALGRALDLHDTIDSTNERAKQLAREGAPHGLLVAARGQSSGRGRLGRAWDSPLDAGVYASFVVRPAGLPLRAAPMLTLAAGVAVVDAARAATGFAGALKWPNDLWVPSGPLARRKVGGILVETSARGDVVEWAVIGIGLNVREAPRSDQAARVAASLEALTGRAVAVADVLVALASALEDALDLHALGGPAPVLDRWRQSALGVGERVRIGDLAGIMEGVAEDGALLVRDDAGTVRRAYAGDLELPPPPAA